MVPVISSGFRNVGHVLGPWTDFFPSSGGLGNPGSQFGVALGTTIQGGSKGATVTSITVEPPFQISGFSGAMLWRVLVVKGKIPPSLSQLDNKWQHAVNGYPAVGDSDLEQEVLFSRMIGNTSSPNSVSDPNPKEWIFPDLTGPSIAPGEEMTIFMVPMFNGTGVPGYGANNFTFASMTVTGAYERRLGAGAEGQAMRSIPRQMVGGI